MVSEANLRFLRSRGAAYIVGTPKTLLRKFEQHLLAQDWQNVEPGVEVKLVSLQGETETFVLARSADRRQKEKAMHERFLARIEAGLTKLQAAADSGRLKDAEVANRRLGRLLQKNSRAAQAFEVTIERLRRPCGKAHLRVTWQRDARWSEWAALSEGCYLLRAHKVDADAATLWKRYIQLTDAEWAFRITKDELHIRPIWHQTPDRVQAHILVCFLAYVMWKTLAQWMQRARLGDAPRPVVDELAKIKSGDVVLPTLPYQGQPRRTVRLRCVTLPDAAQKVLLNRLGLTLPQRLRRLDDLVLV
jgi:transposase